MTQLFIHFLFADEGYGVKEDKVTSLEYLTFAVMKSHAVLQCLYDGYGVNENKIEGFEIIQKFALNGHQDANKKLFLLRHL